MWLLVGALTVLLVVRDGTALAGKGDKTQARSLLREGNEHFRRQRFEEALRCYQRAYELFPSYKLHYNMARTLRRLGRNTRVARALERFFYEGGEGVDTSLTRRARALLDSLREDLSSLTVACTQGAAVMVSDGDMVFRVRPERAFYLAPGSFQLKVSLPGHRRFSQELTLARGEHRRIQVELVPLPAAPGAEDRAAARAGESRPADRTAEQGPADGDDRALRHRQKTLWGYSTLGLGAACLVVAAALYGVGGVQGGEAHDAYMAAADQPEMDVRFQQVEEARRLLIAGHVLAGLAAVAMGVGAYQLLTRPEDAGGSARRAAVSGLGLGFRRGGAGLLLQGEF